MSMEKLLAACGAALFASSAHAAIIHTYESPDVYTSQVAGAQTIDFNDGSCGAYVQCNGATIVSGSVPGHHATPYGITDNYLTVGHGSASLALNGTYDYFGLYWGSIDTYNYLSFYLDSVLVKTFSGSDLGLLANGNQVQWSSNRYLNFLFTGGDLFNRVVVRSDGYAFESDNHAVRAVSVPEPATLSLLAAGLLGAGLTRRRRSTAAA